VGLAHIDKRVITHFKDIVIRRLTGSGLPAKLFRQKVGAGKEAGAFHS
jgi:hypothetical protein